MATQERSLGFIILAGGRRILNGSQAPKLLEPVEGRPVLGHIIQAIYSMKHCAAQITVIISSTYEQRLRSFLSQYSDIQIAVQENHRGTADAVWRSYEQGVYPTAHDVMILMGDMPLVTADDLDLFYQKYLESPHQWAAIQTFIGDRRLDAFQKCGKVIKRRGKFTTIQPRAPLTSSRREELHAGPYLFESKRLIEILAATHPLAIHHDEEFHLYVALMAAVAGAGVRTCRSRRPENFLGVDTPEALAEVKRRMVQRQK
jgi:bifunctional N-acetylglucosamine-1-phosphate-uridyltransferase/glucosamine-1-phosphate-acetyltransferase GlmU-like protein